MKITKIKQELLKKGVETVCGYIFGGSGRVKGAYYNVGDIHGAEGDSLKVNIATGVWEDFANPDHKGDIVDLFVYKYGDKQIAYNEACSFCGITRSKNLLSEIKKKRDWLKPEKNWRDIQIGGKVYEYFLNKRKIPSSVIADSGRDLKEYITEQGSSYVFLSYDSETNSCCGANYCSLRRKEGKDGKKKKVQWQSKSPKSVLWGMDTCDMNRKELIITEGQIDCLSYRAQGFKNSVSIPFGTGDDAWIENSWDFLEEFDIVYLSFDDDDPGREYADKVANRIGLERCLKVSSYPDGAKDANEAHVKDLSLRDGIKNAKEFKPEKLVDVFELFDDAWDRILRGRRELQGIPFCGWENDEETVNFRVRQKEMTIFTGYPGSGKSSILYQHIAYLIFQKNQKVVIASLEEDAGEIAMLIATLAASRVFGKTDKQILLDIFIQMKNKLYFYHHRNRADFKDVLMTGEYTIRKHGAQHFVFDSVAKTNLNIEDNEQANEFVGRVCSSMNETGSHYYLVAHARKGNDRSFDEIPTINEIKGAAAFGIECFNVITMWRNKPKEALMSLAAAKGDGEYITTASGKKHLIQEVKRDWADSLLVISKQKVGGQLGQYKLWYNRENYRLRRGYELTDEPYYVEDKEEIPI